MSRHPKPPIRKSRTAPDLPAGSTGCAPVYSADDGIVSTAGPVVGVAGAISAVSAIFTAGVAGLTAGAVSMALGEYVSVSSQRDTERALLRKERDEPDEFPQAELDELAGIYRNKGLSEQTARQVAIELSANDAFAAHADAELGIDPHALTNPWHAAGASALAFTLGTLLPLAAILLPPTATCAGHLRRRAAGAGAYRCDQCLPRRRRRRPGRGEARCGWCARAGCHLRRRPARGVAVA